MEGMKVSELAQRSGVPATTVRFYEREGLLPARRSATGYRLYEDIDVERLAFINTAKGLGLPLSEVKLLLESWAHGLCRDVQGELAPMLDQRIAETRQRIEDLHRFGTRLATARDQLRTTVREGPCDPSCAFLGSAPPPDQPAPGLMSLPQAPSDAVIACALDNAGRIEQSQRWQTVLETATSREPTDDGARVVFDPERTAIADLAEVAAAEGRCCPFLTVSLQISPVLCLEVRAPVEALVVVDELLGTSR